MFLVESKVRGKKESREDFNRSFVYQVTRLVRIKVFEMYLAWALFQGMWFFIPNITQVLCSRKPHTFIVRKQFKSWVLSLDETAQIQMAQIQA